MSGRSDSMTNLGGPSSLAAAHEDPKQLPGKLVNALYRVVKGSLLHAGEANNAVTMVIESLVQTTDVFCEKLGVSSVSVLFTPHAVFVNRAMLKCGKETYQLAMELGELLQACDLTEVTVQRYVSDRDVLEFARAVTEFTQHGRRREQLWEQGWETIKARKVLGFGMSTDMPPPVRAARTWAAALMLVRKFYDELKLGKYELRQGIKRVAQKLVGQFDDNSSSVRAGGRLLLSIAATPTADADRSSTLLSTSIIALAMASQLTNDRSLLSSLSSAALLYDAGRQRLTGYKALGEEGGPDRILNEDELALLPVSSVVALTALGKLHPPSLVRTVIVHESQSLRDGAGAPYQGRRSALLLSRILQVAHAFTELRLPRANTTPLGIDEALQVLESQATDNVGRALVKLLTGALGIFPAGTMVELSTGEMGVVLSTPVLPVDFARPPVRIMYDTDAQLMSEPVDVDLARPPAPGEPRRLITRPIDATDQQMKQMRAYVMQLASKRAKRKLEKPSPVKPPASRASQAEGPSSVGSSDGLLSFGSSASSSFSSEAQSHIPASGVSAVPSSGTPSSGPVSDQPASQPSPGPAEEFPSLPPISEVGAPRAAPPAPAPEAPDRKASTVRPQMTRKWDPRREDTAGVAEAAPPKPINAPSASDPNAAPRPNETRSLSWQEYGNELAAARVRADITGPAPLIAAPATVAPPSSGTKRGGAPQASQAPPSPPAPAPGLSDTDAILAAYLADDGEPANNSSSGIDMAAARSFGLRWTSTQNRPSQGGERSSSHGNERGSNAGERDSSSTERSSTGLRWGGTSPRPPGVGSIPAPPHASPAPSRVATAPQPVPPKTERIATGPVVAPPTSRGNERFPIAPVAKSERLVTGPVLPLPTNRNNERMPTAPSVAVPPRSVAEPPPQSLSAPLSASRSARVPAPSSWASKPKNPALEPNVLAPEVKEVEPPVSDPQEEQPAPSGVPVSKRGKAGTSSWGAPRRDIKR